MDKIKILEAYQRLRIVAPHALARRAHENEHTLLINRADHIRRMLHDEAVGPKRGCQLAVHGVQSFSGLAPQAVLTKHQFKNADEKRKAHAGAGESQQVGFARFCFGGGRPRVQERLVPHLHLA
jgi:hypothetical protein